MSRLAGITLTVLIALGILTPVGAETPDFYAHWGDGKAEISSYRVVQPRYGESREGYGVLIFVTEDLNRNTYIKVESPTPSSDRVYVLKLNNVLKFTTGIYDYSVMTSVFSAVEGFRGTKPFELMKVNLSSQEWCGHIFDEVRVADGGVRGALNSYFEREGLRSYSLDIPEGFRSEDHLLIQIRELKGPVMQAGESRSIRLLRSLWSFRTRHRPHALVDARLSKGTEEAITVSNKSYEAIPWRWETDQWNTTVWVETAYPRRILKWEDASGGRAELMVTVREPYWRLKTGQDEVYRQRLEIP